MYITCKCILLYYITINMHMCYTAIFIYLNITSAVFFLAKTPLTKRPAPQIPGNIGAKKNKTASAHLFIVDGPNTIREMGLASSDDQQIVTKLVKLHPKTRWNLLVSRTLQLRDLRNQVRSK